MDDLIKRVDAIHALTESADYIGDALERLEKVPAAKAISVEWMLDLKHRAASEGGDTVGHYLIWASLVVISIELAYIADILKRR